MEEVLQNGSARYTMPPVSVAAARVVRGKTPPPQRWRRPPLLFAEYRDHTLRRNIRRQALTRGHGNVGFVHVVGGGCGVLDSVFGRRQASYEEIAGGIRLDDHNRRS